MAVNQKVLEIVIRAKNEATKVLKGAQGEIDNFGKVGAAGAAVTGFGVASAMALNKAADGALKYGKEVINIQRLTGASAEDASKFAAILTRNGVEGGKAGLIIKTLSGAIAGHSKELAAVGIATEDANGNHRTSAAVLADVAEYYKNSTDKTTALGVASKVLGRGYMTLLPVLAGGADGIAKVTAQAEQNGKVLNQETIDSMKKYATALKTNTEAEEGLRIQAGLAMLPIKTVFVETLGKVVQVFAQLSPGMKKTIMAVVMFGTGLALVVGPIMMLIGFLPMIASGLGILGGAFAAEGIAAGIAWIATLGPVALVIAGIALVAGAVYLIIKNWDKVTGFFSGMWTKLKAFFAKWGVEVIAVLFPFIGVPLLLRKHWDKIGPMLGQVWTKTKAFFRKWGVEILAVLVPFVGVPLVIYKHWDKIGPMLARVWTKVKGTVKRGIDSTIAFVKNLPRRMYEALLGMASMLEGPIRAALKVLQKLNPFQRHSPSLVDNVLSGTGAIRAAYAGLAGMEIAGPKIGGVAAGSGRAVAMGRGSFAGPGGDKPQAVHVFLDGREMSRSFGKTAAVAKRTGAR